MPEYLSESPIWHDATLELLAMDDKPISIFEGDTEMRADIRIEKADPNGREAGKISVMVWQIFGDDDDGAWEPVVSASPTRPMKTSEIHQWKRYLNRAALDLVRPHSEPLLPSGELALVIPSGA